MASSIARANPAKKKKQQEKTAHPKTMTMKYNYR